MGQALGFSPRPPFLGVERDVRERIIVGMVKQPPTCMVRNSAVDDARVAGFYVDDTFVMLGKRVLHDQRAMSIEDEDDHVGCAQPHSAP